MLSAWRRFWFQPGTTFPLEICRGLLGSALLFGYAGLTRRLLDLYGDAGWISREAVQMDLGSPWRQSIFFYFQHPGELLLFHLFFLFCCAALALGFGTRWVKWIVLLGHLSYLKRNPVAAYGADTLAASLLFALALAPIGRELSVDRWLAARKGKPPPGESSWATACTRLIQLQMVVVYFYTGLGKLRGTEWWSGDAVWVALQGFEFVRPSVMIWLAQHYWLVNLTTYGTLALEFTYPFFIWKRSTRPFLLAGAVALHLGISLVMRLYYFSAVMIAGHLAFLRPEWLAGLRSQAARCYTEFKLKRKRLP